jgi:hypothetical protein
MLCESMLLVAMASRSLVLVIYVQELCINREYVIVLYAFPSFFFVFTLFDVIW